MSFLSALRGSGKTRLLDNPGQLVILGVMLLLIAAPFIILAQFGPPQPPLPELIDCPLQEGFTGLYQPNFDEGGQPRIIWTCDTETIFRSGF